MIGECSKAFEKLRNKTIASNVDCILRKQHDKVWTKVESKTENIYETKQSNNAKKKDRRSKTERMLLSKTDSHILNPLPLICHLRIADLVSDAGLKCNLADNLTGELTFPSAYICVYRKCLLQT